MGGVDEGGIGGERGGRGGREGRGGEQREGERKGRCWCLRT